MSVAILIKLKAPDRDDLYIPVATQGVYSTEWVPMARKLGLRWLPLFRTGTTVDVEDLPAVMDEIWQLRTAMAGDPKMAAHMERVDFILESLHEVDSDEIASIFIG
ncbi:MAG: hypothetical protein ACXU86_17490 [Archangium sp.]